MNLHPILVHFPIALLTIYAVLELASLLKPVRQRPYVFYIKATVLLFGAVAAIPTYVTGYIQLDDAQPGTEFYQALIMHFRFATASLIVFAFLALAQASEWLLREWIAMPERPKRILGLSRFVTQTALAPLLALVGLACVTVTGALGGSMVYGPEIDPFVTFIYGLLVK